MSKIRNKLKNLNSVFYPEKTGELVPSTSSSPLSPASKPASIEHLSYKYHKHTFSLDNSKEIYFTSSSEVTIFLLSQILGGLFLMLYNYLNNPLETLISYPIYFIMGWLPGGLFILLSTIWLGWSFSKNITFKGEEILWKGKPFGVIEKMEGIRGDTYFLRAYLEEEHSGVVEIWGEGATLALAKHDLMYNMKRVTRMMKKNTEKGKKKGTFVFGKRVYLTIAGLRSGVLNPQGLD